MATLDELSTILDRIAKGEETEGDIKSLRQLIRAGHRPNEVQLDKYNINIGEGRDIQIGDHIYHGPNAEAIRRIFREVLDETADSARIVLPPIEEGYRFIHYVLTFLSLLGNLITWILLGLLAKSEFPIDYVWKLIVACLKGPKYFVKVLNKEQLKLYQLQGENSKLKKILN